MNQTSATRLSSTFGIDLSDKSATFLELGSAGEGLSEGTFPLTKDGITALFSRPPARIVIEASTPSSWVARLLSQLGHEVVVANPRKLHLISKSSRKTDRRDARTLAQLGRVDASLLHPVWVRSEKCLAARATLMARKQLVNTRTRLITLVRSQCKVHGKRLPKCEPVPFPRDVRELIPDILGGALLPLLDALETLNTQIRAYDREIERLCKVEFPATRSLRQIHGVGAQLALAFVTSIDDPTRFSDSRNVGAYFGLVPRSYQSGNKDPELRISKEGDRDTRVLLVNAATYILRRSSPDTALKRFGRRTASRGTSRDKARARVAVARKLACLLHRLWLTGEVYEPLRNAPKAA